MKSPGQAAQMARLFSFFDTCLISDLLGPVLFPRHKLTVILNLRVAFDI